MPVLKYLDVATQTYKPLYLPGVPYNTNAQWVQATANLDPVPASPGALVPGLLINVTVGSTAEKYLVHCDLDMQVNVATSPNVCTGNLYVDGVAQQGQAVSNPGNTFNSTSGGAQNYRNTQGQTWMVTGLSPGVHEFKIMAYGVTANTWKIYGTHSSLAVTLTGGPTGPQGPQGPQGPAGASAASPAYAMYTRKAALSFPISTQTIIPWDTVENAASGIAFDGIDKFTVVTAGTYLVNASIAYAAAVNTGYYQLRILKNGAIWDYETLPTDDTVTTVVVLPRQIRLAVGDTIQIAAYCNPASSMVASAYPGPNAIQIARIEGSKGDKGDTAAVPSPVPTVHGAWQLNTAQSLVTATVTTILYDTVVTAPVGGLTMTNGVIKVPVAGTYQVNAAVAFNANTTGSRYLYIYKNSSYLVRVAIDQAEGIPTGTASKLIDCAANDTISVSAYQSSGAALTLLNTNQSNTIDVALIDVPAGTGIAGIVTANGIVGDGSTGTPVTLDDTGWVDITVNSGFASQGTEKPQVRRVGQTVFSRGGWNNTGITANGTFNVGTLPAGFMPTQNVLWQAGVQAGGISTQMFVASNGIVSVQIGSTVPLYMMMGVTWLTS